MMEVKGLNCEELLDALATLAMASMDIALDIMPFIIKREFYNLAKSPGDSNYWTIVYH